jgi:hypothetical protein
VVGVISDVRESSVEERSGIEMYLPATQADPEGAELVVRSQVPPEALASSVMRTLRAYNPEQPAAEFRPIQSIVDHAVSPRRFFVLLVGIFAGLGLLLASLGIYGVISYSVTRQTQEIGIRMALGASTERVQLGVIARTMRLVLAASRWEPLHPWLPLSGSPRCYSRPNPPIRRHLRARFAAQRRGVDRGIYSGAPGVADRSDDCAAR